MCFVLGVLRWESQQPKALQPLGALEPLSVEVAADLEKAAGAAVAADGVGLTVEMRRALK